MCSPIFSQSQVEYIDTSPCNCCQAIYKVPVAGWLQIFALAGAIEAKNLAFPTNYGYPPFWGQINKLEPEAIGNGPVVWAPQVRC